MAKKKNPPPFAENPPQWLLTVDPGKRYAGLALWLRGRLVACGRVCPGEDRRDLDGPALMTLTADAILAWATERTDGAPWATVAEFMSAQGRYNQMNADLLELCGVSGAVSTASRVMGQEGISCRVATWKRNKRKADTHPQFRALLTDEERQAANETLLTFKSATGRAVDEDDVWSARLSKPADIVDAVGIGLWALGRFA